MTCGIYSIINNSTGKMYVGQSANIEKRFKQHIRSLNNGYHPNNYLQRAWDKYGEDNFSFDILLKCSEDGLDVEERNFIKLYGTYKSGYNLTWGGDFTPSKHPEIAKKISEKLKGRVFSKEIRKKLSDANKGKNNPNYGKHPSEKTKKKLSDSKKGKNNPNHGKKLSYDHKKKISEKLKGRVFSDKHKKSLSEVQNTSGYYRVRKNKCKSCKQGFTWRYGYYENGKQKSITSVDIKKLENKVKEKGLEWYIIDEGNAKISEELSNEYNQTNEVTVTNSGYYRVSRRKCKRCKHGFVWRYEYYEEGKRKSLNSVDIKKLENKVTEKGLDWYIINGKKRHINIDNDI